MTDFERIQKIMSNLSSQSSSKQVPAFAHAVAILKNDGRSSLTFDNVDFQKIDMQDTDLTGCFMRYCSPPLKLKGVNLHRATIESTPLVDACLQGAHLGVTSIDLISIRGADLRNVATMPSIGVLLEAEAWWAQLPNDTTQQLLSARQARALEAIASITAEAGNIAKNKWPEWMQ